jgi:hypothetical protein
MGIELWFKDDIQNLLLSINASSATAAGWASGTHVLAYRQGYQEALAAIALACGIPPSAIGVVPAAPQPTIRHVQSPGGLATLEA